MKLDHIGIAVHSIDEALGFFQDVLGIRPEYRRVVGHEQVEVAMLPVGDTRVELLEATSEESVIARFLRRRGEGVHHLALQVEDVEAAAERVRRSGKRLVRNRVRTGAGNYRYVFVHPGDTAGVLYELLERSPGHRNTRADGRS